MEQPDHQFKRVWGPYLVVFVLTCIFETLESPDGILTWIFKYPGVAFLDVCVSYCLYRYLFSKDKERIWLLYVICILKNLILHSHLFF